MFVGRMEQMQVELGVISVTGTAASETLGTVTGRGGSTRHTNNRSNCRWNKQCTLVDKLVQVIPLW
jgi:hypothetical protein